MRLASALLVLPSLVAPARAEPIDVRTVTELPAGVPPPPGLEKALAFHDRNGDNLLLFSAREKDAGELSSRWIALDHVVVAGGAARTLHTIKDSVVDCAWDLTAVFIHEADAVTDLDGDGVAEVTFAYRDSCKGGIAPDTIEVFVLEGKDRYRLRGKDRIQVTQGQWVGGGFKRVEPPAAKWPRPFAEQAEKTYKAIIERPR